MNVLRFLAILVRKRIKQIVSVSVAIVANQTSFFPPFLVRFERQFADFCKTEYALSFCNGTSAIEAALFAIGVQAGDEVIVPSCTFHSSIDPICNLGAQPVFADVDRRNFTICPRDVQRKLTTRTKAIIVVHLFGIPADMKAIGEIADAAHVDVIEDVSHAHGATADGQVCGSLGRVGAFSLQGAKAVAAGEGGICVTHNRADYLRMSFWGHFNRNGNAFAEINCEAFEQTGLGFKRRMAPLSALLAKADLDGIHAVNDIMNQTAAKLDAALAGIDGVLIPRLPEGSRNGRRFLFGSELGQVLSAPDVPRQPNEGMLAEYLARAVTDYGETVFSGIHRLPHGTTLSVDASGLRLAPYWNAEPPAELRYRRDDEYAEHFFELFGRAVSCRLDSAGPVAVTLSGGLDSSSVVATIGALSARQEVPPVELFSLVFPDQPVADEWRYAADVARMHALPLHPITPQRPGASSYLDPMARRADLLELPSDQMAQPMKAAIRDRGIRVALTGAGGDHGFSGSVHHYADLIRRGRLMTLVRRLVTDARTEDMGWEPSSLIVGGIWPLVPRSLRALISPVARRIRGYRGYPAWIPAEFATRVGLERRLRPERDETVAGGRAVQEIRREYTSGWVQYHIEQAERCAAEMGIEERQPFFDRRVIEFALALPDEQRWRGTLTKHVIRQALGDHLPPSVRNRPDKSDFTHVAVQSLQALGGRNLFEHLEIASLGWVDQRQIVRLYAEMEQQLAAGGDDYDIFGLWMVAGVELWFRAMFGRERETAVAADPVAVAV